MNFALLPPIWLDETDSTNAEAMRILKQGKPREGSCIVARYQSEGRGQRSNNWESASGENLLVSFILYPPAFLADRPFLLSKTIAIAVQKTIAFQCLGKVQIKWPNDILLDGRKCAGILIENQWSGSHWQAAIAGIGINVNQTNFPIEHATSIALHTRRPIAIDHALRELQSQLSKEYTSLCNGNETAVNLAYDELLFGKEDYYMYETALGAIKAMVAAVSNDGLLELVLENGQRNKFNLSEVRLKY